MKGAGVLLAVVGVVVLLAGLGMPATETQTATTCVDSQYDRFDSCAQTTYSTPNYGRGGFIMFGVGLFIGGVILAGKEDSSKSGDVDSVDKIESSVTQSSGKSSESTSTSGPTRLANRIEEQTKKGEE